MELTNWCYQMCDSVILPLIAIGTFLWTGYQELRHRKEQNTVSLRRR